MKILVTGGAGFIGSQIVDKLVELGNYVVIIDNLSTGKKENLNKKAKFYKADICSEKIFEIFKKENFDVVIHQAAQTSVICSEKNPEFDAKVNVLGTINLLECCRKFSVEKFLYASSAAIYGNPKYFPIDEAHPKEPISVYGMNKYVAELYLKFYNSIYGIRYISLRYSNVYGPRQNYENESGVVTIFLNKLINGEKPTIYGNGSQTRDFIYIDDVVNANILAIGKKISGEFNISTNKETSIIALYKKIQKILGIDISPKYAKGRNVEIFRSVLDNRKAIKELGWKPKISIEEGLRRTIGYMKKC
ncbi:MAG: GDP-mannose 4,6-dehydratase [Candidatus Altiarchaeota archaeon]